MGDRLAWFREGLIDESLRFAILVGLATVPVTLALSVERVSAAGASDGLHTGGTVPGLPLLLAALVVGYRYSEPPAETHRAGVWMGLAAAVGLVVLSAATTLVSVWPPTSWLELAFIAALPVVWLIGVGLTVLVTVLAVRLVGFAVRRIDRQRRQPTGGDGEDDPPFSAGRWILLGLYAVSTPLVLVAVWKAPDGSSWVPLAAFGSLGLWALSIASFYVLFVAVTEPRPPGADWLPTWWLYAGFPLAIAGCVYVAAWLTGSANPPGDAVYGFFAALWLAVVAYLAQGLRHEWPLWARLRAG